MASAAIQGSFQSSRSSSLSVIALVFAADDDAVNKFVTNKNLVCARSSCKASKSSPGLGKSRRNFGGLLRVQQTLGLGCWVKRVHCIALVGKMKSNSVVDEEPLPPTRTIRAKDTCPG
eukprot:scaffold1068_cov167-Amphora_coffeaeformis.AAC.5